MNSDTLFIIGNGFDLHHGLKTQYKDFRESKVGKCQNLRNVLYNIFGDDCKKDLWWYEFEENLSHIDYNRLMSIRNGEVLGSFITNDFFSYNLAFFFGEWIKEVDANISKEKVKKLDFIDCNSLFFSFNYTTLLENIYNVEPQNIWHIHNSVRGIKKGISPIVGHDSNERDVFKIRLKYEENHALSRKDLLDPVDQAVSKGAKKVKIRIEKNHDKFVDLYSNIKSIVVMGFSFNDIDMPYIKEILNVNKDIQNTTWKIYWHADGENERIKEKLLHLGIVGEEQISFEYW